MFKDFVLHWGAWAVAIGTFFEGETIVVAAGAMAHKGLLTFKDVALAAFIGSTLGDTTWFMAGRYFGRPMLDKNEKWRKRSQKIQQFSDRFGIFFVLIFRFIYGIRTVTPAVLGATHYPVARYMILNAISAAIWAVAFTSIGWGLGEGIKQVLSRRGHIYELVLAAILLSAVLWIAWIFLKKKTPLDDTPEKDQATLSAAPPADGPQV
jgi:membrane protein DedA with SNARE-associated domain